MSFHKMLPLFLLLTAILAAIAATATAVATLRPNTTVATFYNYSAHAAVSSLPGCPHICGNLSIPYPFGTYEGCYKDESFLIICDDYNKPFLGTSNVRVLNISLHGELQVSSPVAYDCDNTPGRSRNRDAWMRLSNHSISYTRNKFMAVGCDSYAYVRGSLGAKYSTGCMSLCFTIDDAVNGSCSGIGCCQTSIPQEEGDFHLSVRNMHNLDPNMSRYNFSNPCSFAFVVEEGMYHFSKVDLYNLSNIEEMPLVLDWAIRSRTCEEACGSNSKCYESDNISGYRCNCSNGYQGNPYLPNGCQDIDECSNPELNSCTNDCQNTYGGFTCSCPKGYHGDGKRNGEGCIANKIWPTVGIVIAILVLAVGCCWLYWRIKKRNFVRSKEFLFQQNGGLILQQQLPSTVKIFTQTELKKATNNFDKSMIIGQGGFGLVYKGLLPDNRVLAIKRSSGVDQSQVHQFVNEVIVLSRIYHRNVVRLLGCCLENEVPLLVYEFITNGSLYHHLHEVGNASLIPWEIRVRIAKDVARALSYFHSEASIPIIHRDVKSTNILLDTEFCAKISDFGISRFFPLEKTQLTTTLVQGTLGYIDPEYLHTGHLSEKSDVYSFGVILVELLTSKKAFSPERPDKEKNLATYFIDSMKENQLFLVLDDRIVTEDNANQVCEVASLALSCLRLKGDERPTMMEVAMELERVASGQLRVDSGGSEMGGSKTDQKPIVTRIKRVMRGFRVRRVG